MPCSYPTLSQDARTFAELFDRYSFTWPAAWLSEASRPKWPNPEAYAEHLVRLAEDVARAHPDVDIWDGHFDEVLRHTMAAYDPARGPFDSLFGRNLAERLRRSAARAAVTAHNRRSRERKAAAVRRRRGRRNVVAEQCRPWALRLLLLAAARLGHRERVCLEMHRVGARVRDISRRLGVTEKTVWNTLSKRRLARKVREEIKALVGELPGWHLRLLVRHLSAEVGLTGGVIRDLLGGAPVGESDGSVPVLEEEDLLEVLGWPGGFSAAGSTYSDLSKRVG